MAIRTKKYLFIGLITFFLLSLFITRVPSIDQQHEKEHPQLSAITIVDKVYTFIAPEDNLCFIDMLLQKEIMYYIYVEIVTPHNCNLNITLWDPQHKRYDIFSSYLAFAQQGYEHAEIPFGTALSGNYCIQFHTILNFNLNLYIRIEEGDFCLRDKIPSGEWSKIIFYRVTQFYDGMYIEHNFELESDTCYLFYFGRVSSIATTQSNAVFIYNNLTDPENIEFELYTNNSLGSTSMIQSYDFGTSNQGVYTMHLRIECAIDYINLGYAIIKNYVISDMNDDNHTGTPNNSTNYEAGVFSIPSEIIMILTISIISIVSILGVFVYHRRQYGNRALKLSDF